MLTSWMASLQIRKNSPNSSLLMKPVHVDTDTFIEYNSGANQKVYVLSW